MSHWLSLPGLWTPNSYVCIQVQKHLLWCPLKESSWAEGTCRHSAELFSCWTIWRGNKRPGLGTLALCIFIIWFSLARLCPLFTSSGPEQTSPLAGVSFLQAPFCPLVEHWKVHKSTYPLMILVTPPPISFAVLFATVISSAGVMNTTVRVGSILAALFWVIWKENAQNNCHDGWLLSGKCFD